MRSITRLWTQHRLYCKRLYHRGPLHRPDQSTHWYRASGAPPHWNARQGLWHNERERADRHSAGHLRGGYVATWLGLRATLLVMGGLYLLTTSSLLVNPALKQM